MHINNTKLLDIFLITYNRSGYLSNLITNFLKSDISVFGITILDNCSTDGTEKILSDFAASCANIKVIRHRDNIGGPANICHAFELSDGIYTWVLCDDDDYNFHEISLIIDDLKKEKVELFHVGAHKADWNFGGQVNVPEKLIKNGYNYFKYGSFLPCNIFKTEILKSLIPDMYAGLDDFYPHMVYLRNIFSNKGLVKISDNRIVEARAEGAGYSMKQWLLWWMKAASRFEEVGPGRVFFYDHFGTRLGSELNILVETCKEGVMYNMYVKGFVRTYFKKEDRNKFYRMYYFDKISRLLK